MNSHVASINRAYRLIREFRKLHPELSCQVAEAFLIVAMDERTTVGGIADRMGISASAASRHVAHLGKYDRRKNPGLALIEMRESAEDRRIKELRLTAKGRRIRDSITDILE